MFPIPPLEPQEDALPAEQVRFQEVRVEPWPEGRRVRVHVTLTPFEQRPNLTAQISDSLQRLLCQADIIETMNNRLVFTMHLRGEELIGPFHLDIVLLYPDMGQVDQRVVAFQIDEPAA